MGNFAGYRGGATACCVAKTRAWKSCKKYEPIGRDNDVCMYSGCLNYCERAATERKEAPKPKKRG